MKQIFKYPIFIVVFVALVAVGYAAGASRHSNARSRPAEDNQGIPEVKELVPYWYLSQLARDEYFGSPFRHYLERQWKIESEGAFTQPFHIIKYKTDDETKYFLVDPGLGTPHVMDIEVGSLSELELGLLHWMFVSVDFVSDNGFTLKKIEAAIASGSISIESGGGSESGMLTSLSPSEVSALKKRIIQIKYDIGK